MEGEGNIEEVKSWEHNTVSILNCHNTYYGVDHNSFAMTWHICRRCLILLPIINYKGIFFTSEECPREPSVLFQQYPKFPHFSFWSWHRWHIKYLRRRIPYKEKRVDIALHSTMANLQENIAVVALFIYVRTFISVSIIHYPTPKYLNGFDCLPSGYLNTGWCCVVPLLVTKTLIFAVLSVILAKNYVFLNIAEYFAYPRRWTDSLVDRIDQYSNSKIYPTEIWYLYKKGINKKSFLLNSDQNLYGFH